MTTPTRPGAIDIETWTEEAISSLSAVHISAITASSPPTSTPRSTRVPRGTSVTLDIPLDDEHAQFPETRAAETTQEGARPKTVERSSQPAVKYAYANGTRRLIRRDSQRRREALLKGKEGSRRRQKWENDRLLGNPHREEPLPSDWDIKPTHPVHNVPYFLAPLWNERDASLKLEQQRQARHDALPDDKRAGTIPKEIRARLKRAKGAKQLLQDLEEQVREFVLGWEEVRGLRVEDRQPEQIQEKERDGTRDRARDHGVALAEEVETYSDDEEDEIIFVGRGKPQLEPQSEVNMTLKSENRLEKDKMILSSDADDHGARFGRWLVHSLAMHYNLRTWSVTHGNPARREAYIGLPETGKAKSYKVPRPLWVSI